MSHVCDRCIDERGLAEFIRENATSLTCDYCGRKARRHAVAVDFEKLSRRIVDGIKDHYEDPANSVGWDSGEGGYQLSTLDSWEVLEQVGVSVEHDGLREALVEALPHPEWVRRHPYSVPEEDRLRLSWEEFSRLVKHRVRYLLFPSEHRPHDEQGAISPSEMLDELGSIFSAWGLIRKLKAGTRLYRVRIHKPDEVPANTMAALGPPPVEAARFANRMSPAGMSMFYGARDAHTALAETFVRRDGAPASATIATFELITPLKVLQLTKLPDVPSIFSSDGLSANRPALHFLRAFVRDFTRPIEKDGREHTDYVPSQVVTEYVRYRLGEVLGTTVSGILYPSSRRSRGIGCCLFVDHDDINAEWFPVEPPFRLLADQTATIPLSTDPAATTSAR